MRDPRATWRLELSPYLEREAAKAQRAKDQPLRKRRIQVGSKTYTAFDAHFLLEITGDANRARPGHPFGA